MTPMGNTSTLTTLFSAGFGALLGIVGLVGLAYFSGFIDLDGTGDAIEIAESATPGMDLLEAYQCRKGETKTIILGGVEDNYSAEGDETVPESEFINQIRMLGSNDMDLRHYDDGGQDKYLVPYFELAKTTAHGLYVVRMRELSTIRGDGILIGELIDYSDQFNYFDGRIAELPDNPNWSNHGDLYFAKLDDLTLKNPRAPEMATTVLDLIQTAAGDARRLGVSIADDTIVDFMGFTLCLGPEKREGMVFRVNALEELLQFAAPDDVQDLKAQSKNIKYLHNARFNGQYCDPYIGCWSCDKEASLACFHASNFTRPRELKFLSYSWSGGEVAFTTPVQGSRFKTAEDVHKYCQQQFGTDWRALSRHDGHAGGRISVLAVNKPATDVFWVDVKGEEHANCWRQRPEVGN